MDSNTKQDNRNKKLNSVSPKNQLEKIKSIYFLQKMFDILNKSKFLGIIKINNAIQKKLNLNIKDYKEYSEIFSPIEIELIPIKMVLDHL